MVPSRWLLASCLGILSAVSSVHGQTLESELNDLDSLRNGYNTPFDKVEEEAQMLFKKYDKPEEHAQIYYQLAHIYAQSGVQHPDRITKYANEALKQNLTPQQRWLLYSYMASACEVDKSVPSFPDRRRRAARYLLEGLNELSELDLPEVAPEPAVMTITDSPRAEDRKKMAEQMAARKRATVLGRSSFPTLFPPSQAK